MTPPDGAASGICVALEPARQPEVLALIDALDAYQKSLYPPESHHGIDIDALSQPNVVFAVARDEASGRAVGCGAVVLAIDEVSVHVDEGCRGELKRMFVEPAQRGRGVARALLALLECEATHRGCSELALETGVKQLDAITMYERSGFTRCGPFGGYVDDPLSAFMRKGLGATCATAEQN